MFKFLGTSLLRLGYKCHLVLRLPLGLIKIQPVSARTVVTATLTLKCSSEPFLSLFGLVIKVGSQFSFVIVNRQPIEHPLAEDTTFLAIAQKLRL